MVRQDDAHSAIFGASREPDLISATLPLLKEKFRLVDGRSPVSRPEPFSCERLYSGRNSSFNSAVESSFRLFARFVSLGAR